MSVASMEEKHKAPLQCLTRNVNNFWIPEPISFLKPLAAKARQYVNPTPLYMKLCQVTVRHSIQFCSEDIVPTRDQHIARDTLAICTYCILLHIVRSPGSKVAIQSNHIIQSKFLVHHENILIIKKKNLTKFILVDKNKCFYLLYYSVRNCKFKQLSARA